MIRAKTALFAGFLFLLPHAGPAVADPGAEMYIDRAQEILHHSCASLAEETSGDELQMNMVVGLMVAVSLYNREIDITDFSRTDEENAALSSKFVAAVKKDCEEDADSLLAGVVDRAIVHILTTE